MTASTPPSTPAPIPAPTPTRLHPSRPFQHAALKTQRYGRHAWQRLTIKPDRRGRVKHTHDKGRRTTVLFSGEKVPSSRAPFLAGRQPMLHALERQRVPPGRTYIFAFIRHGARLFDAPSLKTLDLPISAGLRSRRANQVLRRRKAQRSGPPTPYIQSSKQQHFCSSSNAFLACFLEANP